MNDMIKKVFTQLLGEKKVIGITSAILLLAVFGVAFEGKGIFDEHNMLASVASSMQDSSVVSDIPEIAIVGVEIATSSESLGSSWSGKIISLGNIPIQPQREGTLVEWRVKIGQWVNEGQILGKLSSPPVMPERITMLADKVEMLARVRAQAATTEIFTEKTIAQLKVLGASFEDTTAGARDKNTVTAQKQNLRVFVEQALFKHTSTITNVTSPSLFHYGSLNRQYGELDQSNRNAFEIAFMKLAEALRDSVSFPFDAAQEYFAVAVRLANTTPESSDIINIRTMMRDDQEKFLTMFADITKMNVDNKKMQREINEKIADNERMLAMARAEVVAVEAAYTTIERSINGSVFIVAPRSGTISTINKNVGEFVGPGTPIASLNASDAGERFVRFSIPSNIKLPKVGDTLSVVRPGFSHDIQSVKLIGVGTSLDATGAYMADATFLGPVDWPVDASVRVIAPQSSSNPIIAVTSVLWGEGGAPYVWGVSDIGRIFAKKIIIGRTLGTSVEVYEGLKNGDRYIISPTMDIREDSLIGDTIKTHSQKNGAVTIPAKSGKDDTMGGMQM